MASPLVKAQPYSFHFSNMLAQKSKPTLPPSTTPDTKGPAFTLKFQSDQQNVKRVHMTPSTNRRNVSPLNPKLCNEYNFKVLTPKPTDNDKKGSASNINNIEELNNEKKGVVVDSWVQEKKELTQQVKNMKLTIAQLKKQTEKQSKDLQQKQQIIRNLTDKLSIKASQKPTFKLYKQVHQHSITPHPAQKIKTPSFSHEYQYVLNHFNLCLKDSQAFDKLKKQIARLKAFGEKDLALKLQHSKEKEAKLSHFLKKAEKQSAALTHTNAFLSCELAKHVQLLESTTSELQLAQVQVLNSKYSLQ